MRYVVQSNINHMMKTDNEALFRDIKNKRPVIKIWIITIIIFYYIFKMVNRLGCFGFGFCTLRCFRHFYLQSIKAVSSSTVFQCIIH